MLEGRWLLGICYLTVRPDLAAGTRDCQIFSLTSSQQYYQVRNVEASLIQDLYDCNTVFLRTNSNVFILVGVGNFVVVRIF